MLRSRRSTDHLGDDDGSAALEFIVAGAILLVPIVYLIVALGIVQSHALGVQAAARHVARAVATASNASAAEARSDAVLTAIADEYGLDDSAVDVTIGCREAGECPRAGALIVVTVRADAPLPLVPPVLGLDDIARVPVEATAVQRMSRLWGTS